MWELLTVNISERGVQMGILGILRSRNILTLWRLRTLPEVFGSCHRGHEKPPSGAAGPLEVHAAHDLQVSGRHWGWKYFRT